MKIKRLKDYNILIVDDDPYIIKSITRVLKDAKFKNIFSCKKGPLVIDIINAEEKIDILISDLKMPDFDGIQLIRYLSDTHNYISLLIISGESEHVLQAAENIAVERNINLLGTLQKPIQSTKLLALIKSNKKLLRVQQSSHLGSSIEADFIECIQHKALSVFYQPQIDIKTGKIIGVEALARWHHKKIGVIPPSIFIPLAERLQLINELTDQITNKVLREFPFFLIELPWLTISINYSIDCLIDLDLPEKLEVKLKENNLYARQIVIEITESLITESLIAADLATILDILSRLRLKGFGLSIDDFGTGFSTMEQVSRIPFTELKIDQSFVHGAEQNMIKKAILESSIDLAKRIGMRTVAEGVENSADLEIVKHLECDVAQGFYYAKPVSFEELRAWIVKKNNLVVI